MKLLEIEDKIYDGTIWNEILIKNNDDVILKTSIIINCNVVEDVGFVTVIESNGEYTYGDWYYPTHDEDNWTELSNSDEIIKQIEAQSMTYSDLMYKIGLEDPEYSIKHMNPSECFQMADERSKWSDIVTSIVLQGVRQEMLNKGQQPDF